MTSKKTKPPKVSLFHGPGLKLFAKWRCPLCKRLVTKPISETTPQDSANCFLCTE